MIILQGPLWQLLAEKCQGEQTREKQYRNKTKLSTIFNNIISSRQPPTVPSEVMDLWRKVVLVCFSLQLSYLTQIIMF